MNFADIFKQSFLQGYASSSLTVTSVVSCMVCRAMRRLR